MGQAGAKNLWKSRLAGPLVVQGEWLRACPLCTRPLPGIIPFISQQVLQRGRYGHPHFTDEKPEAHTGRDHPSGQRQMCNSNSGLPEPQMVPLSPPPWCPQGKRSSESVGRSPDGQSPSPRGHLPTKQFPHKVRIRPSKQ